MNRGRGLTAAACAQLACASGEAGEDLALDLVEHGVPIEAIAEAAGVSNKCVFERVRRASLRRYGHPPADRAWRELLAAVDRHMAEHEELRVPVAYVDPTGYPLGQRLLAVRRCDGIARILTPTEAEQVRSVSGSPW